MSPLLRIQIDGRKVGLNVHESIIQFIREGVGEGRGGGGGGSGMGVAGGGGGGSDRYVMLVPRVPIRSHCCHLDAGVILMVTV